MPDRMAVFTVATCAGEPNSSETTVAVQNWKIMTKPNPPANPWVRDFVSRSSPQWRRRPWIHRSRGPLRAVGSGSAHVFPSLECARRPELSVYRAARAIGSPPG